MVQEGDTLKKPVKSDAAQYAQGCLIVFLLGLSVSLVILYDFMQYASGSGRWGPEQAPEQVVESDLPLQSEARAGCL